MNLTIKVSRKDCNAVVNLPHKIIGLDWVDKIRISEGRFIPIKNIDSYVHNYYRYEFEFDISEKDARESGRFKEKSVVEIKCPKDFLNEFFYIDYRRIEKDDEDDGDMIEYRCEYVFDKNKFLQYWKEHDYTLDFCE